MSAASIWADRFRHRLISERIARAEEIRGCSDAEVAELARTAGVGVLPEFYAEWLRAMGRGAGMFLRGSAAFYPELLEVRAVAADMMEESGLQLARDALVCAEHQGYQFTFFHAALGIADPPVWVYVEGRRAPEEKWPGVSGFFEACLADEITARTGNRGPSP